MSILLFIFLVTLKKGSSSSSYIGKLYIMYVVLFIGFRNIEYIGFFYIQPVIFEAVHLPS